MTYSIPVAIFSSAHLLRPYAYGEYRDLCTKKLERFAFIDSWSSEPYLPDYVHKNSLRSIIGGEDDLGGFLCSCLDYLAKLCLEINGDVLAVYEKQFALWQEIITEISPIILMSWMISKDEPIAGRSPDEHARALIKRNIRAHIFPGYNDPLLEECLRKVGLCDLHVHLNGSTPSDVIWQDALALPRKFRAKLNKEWSKEKEEVDELFQQLNPYFSRWNLTALVDIADNLRDWLVRRLFSRQDCPLEIDSLTRSLECQNAPCARHSKRATCIPSQYCANNTDSCETKENRCIYEHRNCSLFNWWKKIYTDNPLDRFTLYAPHPPLQHRIHALQKHFPELVNYWCPGDRLQQEAYFLVKLFKTLREEHTSYIAQTAHYYFLIQGLFTRLLVQQANQCGFDQFQKITQSGLREQSEAHYTARLRQFAEGSVGVQTHVEARFAPKDTTVKLRRLLSEIGTAYYKFRNGSDGQPKKKRLELSLVAHFIKRRDKSKFYGCQHYLLRRTLAKQARLLTQLSRPEFHRGLLAGSSVLSNSIPKDELRKSKPPFPGRPPRRRSPEEAKDLLSGFDAAGNELQTPPEVFAPVFRMLRRNGMNNFSFHAGEDFNHLVSGIRAVDEAVTFLDLGSGSRIGHATALGINPALWIRKVGPKIPILCSEWLDTLVYAYQILHQSQEFSGHAGKALDTIHEYSQRVYGKPYSPQLLWQAWKLRWLDPIRSFVDKDNTRCLDLSERVEWTYIKKFREKSPAAFKVFEKYHSKRLFGQFNPSAEKDPKKKRNLYVEVETDFFSEDEIIYLQREMIKKLNEKCIAIETLISSNVRISFYKTYDEHHILRWLGLDDHFKGEPRPTVCLGTDDPGIFATSIKNECLHLLCMLQHKGCSQTEAVQIIEQLITNSKAYRFRRKWQVDFEKISPLTIKPTNMSYP